MFEALMRQYDEKAALEEAKRKKEEEEREQDEDTIDEHDCCRGDCK